MNTSTPLDPRSLAHRLTTVGHGLHHRLFAQLRDSGIHPKTVLLLGAVDGRVDAPWITARLARGGKRIDALVEQGWIARGDEGWALTDEGRAVLDRVDAARAALLADVPADELERLATALDAVSAAIGVDESETSHPFGPAAPGAGRGFGPFGRGFGPGMRGFGPRFGADPHAVRAELARVTAEVIVVGVPGELLFPYALQVELYRELQAVGAACSLWKLDSECGHDAFLADQDRLGALLRDAGVFARAHAPKARFEELEAWRTARAAELGLR